MNTKQKIQFLARNGVKLPDGADEAAINTAFAKFQNRVVNFKGGGGTITVAYDLGSSEPVEMTIYEDIGQDPWTGVGFTAKDFCDALKDVPNTRPLDIRINSAGGEVWEGLAIKSRLDEWKGRKTASIDGMAASVASWLPMSCDEIRAPRHAQMFIHDAWGMTMGNAEDHRNAADDLEKTSQQIADIYASRGNKSAKEFRDMMTEGNGTLFTAEEANALGLIDRLTDDEPVQNFTALQIRNMRSKMAMLNKLKSPAAGGQPTQNTNNMNRKQKITLLNKWGVSVSKNATDTFIDNMLNGIKASLPKNAVKYKSGDSGEHAGDCNCQDCGMQNAPKPDAEPPGSDSHGAEEDDEDALFKAATDNEPVGGDGKSNKLILNFLARQRKNGIQNRLDKLAEAGRLPANEIKNWLDTALAANDTDDGENPIVNQLEKTLPAQLPGRSPLDASFIELGDDDSIDGISKAINKLTEVPRYLSRNGSQAQNLHERLIIGENSKRISSIINRLRKYKNEGKPNEELVGPLRDAYDRHVMGNPRNANTMVAGLLRQVILSEVMRAFRRGFTSLTYFAHNFGNIPLEGTDVVQVPYYPLVTTASTEFTYNAGYIVNANAQTLSKTITVGGIGNGVASPGVGRKYQSLKFNAYEIRRQPWLDIQKLTVMAGEQLALDVRADIIAANINATNFGNAIWTGSAGSFDHTVLGNVLMTAANKAFWPKRGRNVVVETNYHSNLAIDPGLYPFLMSGASGADILNEGLIQNKYSFENILQDPIYPITSYIRGGDGAVTPGTDPNACGYMCWPSAVLVATAPIMTPPGVLKKLVAYEQITDEQTNLAFTYQFFGSELTNSDSEIIECTYGSGPGELAALFRLTSQGN